MTKNCIHSIVNLLLIISLVLVSGWWMFADQQTKIHTFQKNSNLPGVDRGIAVIETRKGDVMAIGVVKKKSSSQW